jgi:hypothetical protein
MLGVPEIREYGSRAIQVMPGRDRQVGGRTEPPGHNAMTR